MKNKLSLLNEELENITGGFEYYLDKDESPVIIMNKDEINFISNNSNKVLQALNAIKKSCGELWDTDTFIFIVKQYLEANGFKNTYRGEV